MQNTTTITTSAKADKLITQFLAGLDTGLNSFQQAGDALVALLEIDPDAKATIIIRRPALTLALLDIFEAIGRRALYYPLCMRDEPGVRALRECAYSEQVRHATEPVEVLVVKDGGDTDTMQIAVEALTREQSRQVFGNRRIRDLGAQRAWIESQRMTPKARPLAITSDYTVRGGKVIIHRPVTLTAADVNRIAGELIR